jgi:hypothetical protein
MQSRSCALLRRALALVVAGTALAAPNRSRADASAEVTPDLPPAVHLTIVGDAPASLEDRLASWFPAESVFTSVTRQHALDPAEVLQPSRRARVGVWIVIREPGARLFFSVERAQASAPRYLTTDLELEQGLDEVGMEQLAQVVYLSSVALWTGQAESARRDVEKALELGSLVEHAPATERPYVPPPASREPAPSTTPPQEQETVWALHSGFGYSVRGRGDEGLAHGPGALFAWLTSTEAGSAGVLGRADLFIPARPENRDVELDVRGYSLRLGGLLSRSLASSVFLRGEASAGLDLVRYSTYAVDDPELLRESGDLDVRPLLAVSAGAELRASGLRFGLSGTLVVQLLRTRYDVAELDGRSALIEPWTFQPGVAFDVAY